MDTAIAALPLADQNSSFSRVLPGLQLAWDSVSTGAAKDCWRKYELSIVRGYQPRHESVHLRFGILLHEAKEEYDSAKAAGFSHDEAVILAVRRAMCATWNRALRRPWDSGDQYKNRYSLVRSIVWYFEEYKDDPIETVRLADGRAAVELSFSFPTGDTAGTGEPFYFAGHLDRVGSLNGEIFDCDIKSSQHELNEKWHRQFSPHNQFTGYAFAMQVVYALPAKGVIVDGVQVGVTFTRFDRRLVYRDSAQIEEWLRGFRYLVRQAEQYARDSFWPMNETACDKYGGCPFRIVCSHSPGARQQWLASDFIRRTWDPLQARGDV